MIPLAALLLLVIAFSLIYYAATKMPVVHLWQEYTLLSRYYDVTYLIIYLVIALFIYPFLYKKYPSILTNCVFYMAVTQIVAAIYLIALSTTYYNGAYNIAYFLKIIVYFIPFTCLIINYIFSYNSYLKTQGLLKINQGKLDYITTHDPLTNLHNRHGFEILLKKTITNNTKENSLFALFIIDIDNFKLINDTLGHVEGDHLLKQFSENLSLLTRKEDILSRIGSDEFALIVTKIASISSAKKIATRMLNQLNIPYRFGNQLLMATASIGIAIYPMDGKNTEDLLKHADIAMQHAKKSGKQSYSFYTKKYIFSIAAKPNLNPIYGKH
ncbi:diguanylate cyclase GGDEF domain protein [Legionella oakridgensis ATCC 33761 = DSM 21215]|uniref:Diguanylate cyclase GGDEF domain protein n=2 Tax=Legionella oakridgensis TaxID=29423 RepID=W0BC04_9GAMM|nr:diguanylate cyclase GGDEF domain protein [Legionella oakridgensis ATCC 33761 = DSM 21215]